MSNSRKLIAVVTTIVHVLAVYLILNGHIYWGAVVLFGFYAYAFAHDRIVEWLKEDA